MTAIRQGTIQEKPLQSSMSLQIQVLIDSEEMEAFFKNLGDFEIYRPGNIVKKGDEKVSHPAFLDCYRSYVNFLKEGKIPPQEEYVSLFSTIWTTSSDCLFALPVQENRHIIRLAKPVVQLQSHEMDYSPHDGKFHSMIFGADSILWGIQISYPQLYVNPETQQVEKTLEDLRLPNTQLFRRIQQWVRQNTIPTPFSVLGKKIHVPMRIGKQCLSWINQHPQLRKKEITVFQ